MTGWIDMDEAKREMRQERATPHSFERQLWALRQAGWRVAVHNDYRLDGQDMTFWLMTNSDGRYLKGEGKSDMDALLKIDEQCRAAAHRRDAVTQTAAEQAGD